MADFIPTPKMGDILREEFMEPMGLSAYKLAKDISVPVSRIQDILHNRRKITADTSIRLGIYFGLTEDYFLNIQNDLDIREIRITEKDDLEKIRKIAFALRRSSSPIEVVHN